MMTKAEARGEVVRIEVRITPRQADHMEQFYRILGITKSEITEAALDEFFKAGQEEVMRKVEERRGTG
jgi:hypothetical protein